MRTGVTAILPRGRSSFQPVFAAFYAGNGNGDMTGTHWIEESGVLETPVMITNTLSVGTVRDAVIGWMVTKNAAGPFWYPVAAETSDGRLNDQKGQHVRAEHVIQALDSARSGRIDEGNVGGGTGMLCNGFKGGTGTSSRVLSSEEGGYTVGVLVQCNYGQRSELRIAGIPVGREIHGYEPCVAQNLDPPVLRFDGTPAPVCGGASSSAAEEAEQGSIIVVAATDAPLTPDQLKRITRRVSLGMGRMGSIHGNGSGDIFIAFSTANRERRLGQQQRPRHRCRRNRATSVSEDRSSVHRNGASDRGSDHQRDAGGRDDDRRGLLALLRDSPRRAQEGAEGAQAAGRELAVSHQRSAVSAGCGCRCPCRTRSTIGRRHPCEG